MTAEHRPIVLARKPGPLQPLAIDACRIGTADEITTHGRVSRATTGWDPRWSKPMETHQTDGQKLGRWPSNVLLSDPALFDEKNVEVVGSGATATSGNLGPQHVERHGHWSEVEAWSPTREYGGDSGGYSRFFRIPGDDLLGHLTKLVSAPGEVVYDPFPFELRMAL